MIYLLFDYLVANYTMHISFTFLKVFDEKKIYKVLVVGLLIDYLSRKMLFNTLILCLLFIVNKLFFKRSLLFKYYYLRSLFNLVSFYTINYLLFNYGILKYFSSLIYIVLFNSIFIILSYYFYRRTYYYSGE